MKRTMIVIFIISLLFTTCTKTIERTSNKGNDINKGQMQNDSEISGKKSDLTIEDISYYIFTDLNIKWDYTHLEDLFKDLNFTDDYKIEERIVKNTIQTGEGFFHVSDIEYDRYKISVFAFSNYSDYIDNLIYRLDRIEIEIDDNNYLDLFPYNTIGEYSEDNNFGEIIEINMGGNNIYYIMRYEQMIKYGDDDRLGYSNLIFSDGLLKSIAIIRFTP